MLTKNHHLKQETPHLQRNFCWIHSSYILCLVFCCRILRLHPLEMPVALHCCASVVRNFGWQEVIALNCRSPFCFFDVPRFRDCVVANLMFLKFGSLEAENFSSHQSLPFAERSVSSSYTRDELPKQLVLTMRPSPKDPDPTVRCALAHASTIIAPWGDHAMTTAAGQRNRGLTAWFNCGFEPVGVPNPWGTAEFIRWLPLWGNWGPWKLVAADCWTSPKMLPEYLWKDAMIEIQEEEEEAS